MSRVRENRMHGSTRRREETGTSRASTSRTEPGASRRPDREAREPTARLSREAGMHAASLPGNALTRCERMIFLRFAAVFRDGRYRDKAAGCPAFERREDGLRAAGM